MNAPVRDFMVATHQGIEHHGPIFATNSMKYLQQASAGVYGAHMQGMRALETLRPCLDAPGGPRVNATLLKDEWILLDTAVQEEFLDDLVGVSDLLSRGLTFNLGNPLGTTIVEWQEVSTMTAASVNMEANTPPENDRVEYALRGMPVPITSKGFQIFERQLQASRMKGDGLDTTQTAAATRVVRESLEDLVFNGDFSYGAYTVNGYTTHPQRSTGSLAGDWSTFPTVTGAQIVTDVREMRQDLINDHVAGPYVLYIPFTWDGVLDEDYLRGTESQGLAAGMRTIRERILSLSGVEAIRPTRYLTDECVLVAMRREVVDLVFGFEPRLVQWEDQGGMVNNFRVMSIMAPRIRRDFTGRSGVSHHSV